MKDGWYYIKLKKDMVKESVNYEPSFTEGMEMELPPTRCIFIQCNCWKTGVSIYTISDYMIEAETFPIGSNVEVRGNNQQEWVKAVFQGYDYSEQAYITENGSWEQCRKPQKPEKKSYELKKK